MFSRLFTCFVYCNKIIKMISLILPDRHRTHKIYRSLVFHVLVVFTHIQKQHFAHETHGTHEVHGTHNYRSYIYTAIPCISCTFYFTYTSKNTHRTRTHWIHTVLIVFTHYTLHTNTWAHLYFDLTVKETDSFTITPRITRIREITWCHVFWLDLIL